MTTTEAANAIAPPDSSVYYQAGYWNDHRSVAAEMNRRISGNPDRGYITRFQEQTANRRFARGLFLNCGSGWVEREFCQLGIVDSAVGIDIAEDLLAQAREKAAGFPIRYARMDVNMAAFPDERYDLVVNFAAGHHIAYVDRVYRELCRRITEDGVMLNYDYVGPHRNQYPYEQWSAVWDLNRRLPENVRQELAYPHLPTMLATDPTEAIHSELTMETFRRYFTIRDYRWIGGALAYPLLTFNKALLSAAPEEREAAIAMVMAADGRYTEQHPDGTLFAYWYGTPRHEMLGDAALLARWEREENAREDRAAANRQTYYALTLLQALVYPELL